jgi:hypothetical protein
MSPWVVGRLASAPRVNHPDGVRVVLAAVLFGGVATAAPVAKPAAPPAGKPAVAAKAPPPVWIGVFDPKLPVHPPWDNAALTAVAHGGTVRVLTPPSGAAATGEVVVVHPLLGKVATGRVDSGAVVLSDFAFDQRDGDDGVIVLPAGTVVAIVTPSKAEVAAITQTLVRTEALARVRRALAGIELGAIDVDGDGRADVVATYGCTAWFDGACQSKGQFFLARRGARWTIID